MSEKEGGEGEDPKTFTQEELDIQVESAKQSALAEKAQADQKVVDAEVALEVQKQKALDDKQKHEDKMKDLTDGIQDENKKEQIKRLAEEGKANNERLAKTEADLAAMRNDNIADTLTTEIEKYARGDKDKADLIRLKFSKYRADENDINSVRERVQDVSRMVIGDAAGFFNGINAGGNVGGANNGKTGPSDGENKMAKEMGMSSKMQKDYRDMPADSSKWD